ncbi:MAG: pantoate--beta-alanine ligase [Solirubrobacteraceae bacterium]|nr:pantoate--beta-alanine ligase [Solirubrobacteraceae bacterium]
MKTVRTVAEMQAHGRAARAGGRRIGLVPTMGAYHGGHESLMRAARAGSDEMVVSLFVNPAQFDDPRDLAAYPRDEEHDAAVAARLGADVLFAPPVEAVYPDGFATSVAVAGLSDVLEGAHRGAAHFAGVCTVVAKLFNMVAPDVAYFGQKDAQQVAVLRRMARDLDFPVEIEVLPTIREPDGLAMSSRNVRLSPEDRRKAAGLSAALRAAAEAIDDDPLEAGLAVLARHGITPEYLAMVDPDTFLEPGPLIVVAAGIGGTRLIDNVLIKRAATPDRRGADPKGALSVLPTP